VVLVGDDVPRAVLALVEARDPRVGVDLGAAVARADRVRVGDAVRVDAALVLVVEGADEVLLLEQRVELLGLLHGDDLHVHAEVAAAGLRHAQPVEALGGVGELEPAGQVDAAVLAGLLLDLAVQVDGVLLQAGHVGVAIERVHASGGVPRRAGRELLALDEHDVGPPLLREVVEHRRPDHSSSDDDDLRGRFHGVSCPPVCPVLEPRSRS